MAKRNVRTHIRKIKSGKQVLVRGITRKPDKYDKLAQKYAAIPAEELSKRVREGPSKEEKEAARYIHKLIEKSSQEFKEREYSEPKVKFRIQKKETTNWARDDEIKLEKEKIEKYFQRLTSKEESKKQLQTLSLLPKAHPKMTPARRKKTIAIAKKLKKKDFEVAKKVVKLKKAGVNEITQEYTHNNKKVYRKVGITASIVLGIVGGSYYYFWHNKHGIVIRKKIKKYHIQPIDLVYIPAIALLILSLVSTGYSIWRYYRSY